MLVKMPLKAFSSESRESHECSRLNVSENMRGFCGFSGGEGLADWLPAHLPCDAAPQRRIFYEPKKIKGGLSE